MKSITTNQELILIVVLLLAAAPSFSQVASHAPVIKMTTDRAGAPQDAPTPPKVVARVNGTVLTEIDLLRKMYEIFPYARQHNGIPKEMETDIRKGAMDMVIFEELLYQEAKRRNLTVSAQRVERAETAFRKQFPDQPTYQKYLGIEMNGSKTMVREKIRRSLLIEKMLKAEVEQKSQVTVAAAKAYYDHNPNQFEREETISIQTISIIPPENASQAEREVAKAKIKDIVRLGRAAKTAREFGLIAEQISEDDWRTKLGDRGAIETKKLPPEVVKAGRAMKPGEVSDPIQLGGAWVVFRLNAHTPAGKPPFSKIKAKLQADLQKQKGLSIRSALNQKLRKEAKIEVL